MGNNPSHLKGDSEPVEQGSWDDVQEFIRRLNAHDSAKSRLPSEAEWEYACRSGGTNEEYASGDAVDRVAWYDKNSGGATHPVGTKAPNGLGLYDMSGNVWEWVEDTYHDSYTSAPMDGSAWTDGGSNRVVRGGSGDGSPGGVRCTVRFGGVPDARHYGNLGFRLVRGN
jgi:formylglycine-generating enzyme required for sulfatase activity